MDDLTAIDEEAASSFEVLRYAIRRQFFWLFAVSAAINVLLLTSSIYLLQVFDRVLTSGSAPTLVLLTIMALLALGAYGGLEFARRQILLRCGLFVESQLTPEVAGHAMQASARGDAVAANASDVQAVRNLIGGESAVVLLDAPWVPLFLLLVALIHPYLALIAAIGAIVLFFMAWANDRLTRPDFDAERALAAKAGALTREGMRSSEAVVGLNIAPALQDILKRQLESVTEKRAALKDGHAAWTSVSRMTRMVIQVVMIGTGAWLAVLGVITAGGMIVASILAARGLSPVERSISAWQAVVSARQGWRRIAETLSQDQARPQSASVRLPKPPARIEVRDVWLSHHRNEEPLLREVNFSVEPGQVCLVAGPSGAGKSSLLRVLTGLRPPAKGAVRIGGTSVASWPLEDFARYVGFLPQGAELLEGTIAENIGRFSKYAPEQIRAAAEKAGLAPVIASLPAGYDTQLGPGGAGISFGQRQRVALARAIVTDPVILILDEPMASQDAAGALATREMIKSFASSGGAVVAAVHDRSLVELADGILVIQQGSARMITRKGESEGAASALSSLRGHKAENPV